MGMTVVSTGWSRPRSLTTPPPPSHHRHRHHHIARNSDVRQHAVMTGPYFIHCPSVKQRQQSCLMTERCTEVVQRCHVVKPAKLPSCFFLYRSVCLPTRMTQKSRSCGNNWSCLARCQPGGRSVTSRKWSSGTGQRARWQLDGCVCPECVQHTGAKGCAQYPEQLGFVYDCGNAGKGVFAVARRGSLHDGHVPCSRLCDAYGCQTRCVCFTHHNLDQLPCDMSYFVCHVDTGWRVQTATAAALPHSHASP